MMIKMISCVGINGNNDYCNNIQLEQEIFERQATLLDAYVEVVVGSKRKDGGTNSSLYLEV